MTTDNKLKQVTSKDTCYVQPCPQPLQSEREDRGDWGQGYTLYAYISKINYYLSSNTYCVWPDILRFIPTP